jgi:hypothetical protein
MSVRSVGPFLCAMVAACGGDGDRGQARPDGGDQAGPDGGDQDAPPLPCPAAPHAFFIVSATAETGHFSGSYDDVSWPTQLEEKRRAGDCAYFAPEPPFCDPECEGESLCATGGICRGFPHPIDIGTVHVVGTDPALDLEPTQLHTYNSGEERPGLYQPGDEITMSAGGSGGVEALSLTVFGVPALLVPPDVLIARDHEDLVVTWAPDPESPPGTEIVFHADNDHHGIRAFVECRAADDGELTVPAAVLDLLIEAGESGIGSYIENAGLARINRDTTDTDLGCAEFQSVWSQSVTVDVVRPE